MSQRLVSLLENHASIAECKDELMRRRRNDGSYVLGAALGWALSDRRRWGLLLEAMGSEINADVKGAEYQGWPLPLLHHALLARKPWAWMDQALAAGARWGPGSPLSLLGPISPLETSLRVGDAVQLKRVIRLQATQEPVLNRRDALMEAVEAWSCSWAKVPPRPVRHALVGLERLIRTSVAHMASAASRATVRAEAYQAYLIGYAERGMKLSSLDPGDDDALVQALVARGARLDPDDQSPPLFKALEDAPRLLGTVADHPVEAAHLRRLLSQPPQAEALGLALTCAAGPAALEVLSDAGCAWDVPDAEGRTAWDRLLAWEASPGAPPWVGAYRARKEAEALGATVAAAGRSTPPPRL